MNAHQLLERIKARGAVATVRVKGRAAVLNVAPRHIALELASDIQRFKTSLLELLAPEAIPRVPLELSPQAIVRASKRLARQHRALWDSMSQSERLQLAVCVACHENGVALPLEWEQWKPGGTA